MDRIQELLDKQDITALLHRYSLALDTRDWALLETCFRADAVFVTDGFEPCDGFPVIRQAIETALGGLDQSQHYLTNVLVSLDVDTATVTSYLQAQHVRRSAQGDPNYVVAGIYRDEVVRTASGWYFARRTLQVTWTEGNPDVPVGKVASVNG
ncbi:nuclear transport factor 2 family protein [Streptomyces sp. NPDC051572]|uniref:nuclear transport factor 2 family protein n=1 Tax=unclassified Streptomyces TaxID=2593676 RepID=UPI00344F3AA0